MRMNSKRIFGVLLILYPTLFVVMVIQSWIYQDNNDAFPSYSSRDQVLTSVYRWSTFGEQEKERKIYNETIADVTTTDSTITTKEHFLTMFTSFNSTMEKFYIYNNTLHGWMLMKPSVMLVFFSDDHRLNEYVRSIGWDLTLNVGLTACNGTPVLKDMFLTVQKHVSSKFYAYANADILFGRGLIKTLHGLSRNTNIFNKPLLMTGKRSDLLLDNHKLTNIRGMQEIDNAFRKSHVSYGYAEDYFVVNNKFPWNIYPDLVIGRAMVDNYLTYIARKSQVNVIDSSSTVNALHQKTKSRKRRPSDCNKDILGKLWQKHKIAKGNVECFPWETRFDFNGSVFIMRRGTFTTVC